MLKTQRRAKIRKQTMINTNVIPLANKVSCLESLYKEGDKG